MTITLHLELLIFAGNGLYCYKHLAKGCRGVQKTDPARCLKTVNLLVSDVLLRGIT
jgi:hypothetical protein